MTERQAGDFTDDDAAALAALLYDALKKTGEVVSSSDPHFKYGVMLDGDFNLRHVALDFLASARNASLL